MHKVEYIHIICTEPRIQRLYHDYLAGNNLFGNYDTVQYENPLLDFLDEQKLSGILERIAAYRKLHSPSVVVLFDHFNCGAYGLGGYKFKNKKEEIQVHQKNNGEAIKIIKKKFPDMEVVVKYIAINPAGNCTWWTPK